MAGKMAKQLAGSGTGQSLMDRVTQAKYSLAGSALGKVVAKASTEEHIPPKKKHLENLVKCSHEPNVSIPLLANFLIERTQEKSWVVVFKTLITTHHLINYGNEKISQYIASNNCQIYLPYFNDKSSSQSYEMSLFIRKYSKYLAEKMNAYKLMAFDFCKVKRGKNDGVMRTMPSDKLLKALPALRDELNTLFEFDATEKDLNNQIINTSFILLYKDLIRLFASYNEGMMNLVEKYFSMKLIQCQEALELYRGFPEVMVKVDGFLTVAETLGIGDKESIGLYPVPPQVLEAMEQHLVLLEKNKKNGEENEELKTKKKKTKTTKPLAKVPMTTPAVPKASPARPITPAPSPSKSPSRPSSSPSKTHPEKPSATDPSIGGLDETTEKIEEKKEEKRTPRVELKPPTHTELIVTDPDGAEQTPENNEYEENEKEEEEEEEEEEIEVEGLSTELQREVIAAATSHFTESAEKTNQAVKKSVGLLSSPKKPALANNSAGRSPSRSRSSSPARPPPPRTPSPSRAVHSTSERAAPDVSDTEEHMSSPAKNSYTSAYDDHNSETEDNQTTHENPILEENNLHSLTSSPAAASIPAASPSLAIDDLLGLDFSQTTTGDIAGLQPTTVTPTLASTVQKENKPKPGSALDDLMSWDPLLEDHSNATTNVSSPLPALQMDPSGLPAGLKPAPSNVLLRPAGNQPAAQKSNPLDQLDSTLANLASSLGGNQPDWGTRKKKK